LPGFVVCSVADRILHHGRSATLRASSALHQAQASLRDLHGLALQVPPTGGGLNSSHPFGVLVSGSCASGAGSGHHRQNDLVSGIGRHRPSLRQSSPPQLAILNATRIGTSRSQPETREVQMFRPPLPASQPACWPIRLWPQARKTSPFFGSSFCTRFASNTYSCRHAVPVVICVGHHLLAPSVACRRLRNLPSVTLVDLVPVPAG